VATVNATRRRTAVVAVTAVSLGFLVAAPSYAASASPTLSTAISNLGTGTTATNDARIIDSRTADVLAGSQPATIVVSLKDAAGTPITSDTLTVTDVGVGVLGTGSGAPVEFTPSSHSISVSVSTAVPGKYVFAIFAGGTGGFSTITIRDGAILIATKIAAFYGPVTILTAHQNLALLDVSGSPLGSNSARNPGDGTFVDTPAVILTAKDANGIPVPNEGAAEFSAISSNLSVLSSEINVVPDNTLGAGSLGAGTYNVQVRGASGAVSGSSATLVFHYSDNQSPAVSTPPVKFTVSSSTIAKVTLSLDHLTYSPGDYAVLTITAADASGNLVSGQDSGNFFASSTGLTTSSPVDKLLFPFTTVTFIDGKATTSFDMPATSGLFTISGRLGNGTNLVSPLQGVSISSTASILSAQDVALAAADASATRAEAAANAALAAVVALTLIVKNLVSVIHRIQLKLGIK
jgi:hypothetical protein